MTVLDASHADGQRIARSPVDPRIVGRRLFAIPPFPGRIEAAVAAAAPGRDAPRPGGDAARMGTSGADALVDTLADALRHHRVGGSYWGSRPDWGSQRFDIRSFDDPAAMAQSLAAFPRTDVPLLLCGDAAGAAGVADVARAAGMETTARAPGVLDPWHLIDHATRIDTDDPALAILAGIAGVPCRQSADWCDRLADAMAANGWTNPFTGVEEPHDGYVALAAFWRALIDSNRPIVGAVGFAFWKQPTVAPLLWAGDRDVAFLSHAPVGPGEVAVWRSRAGGAVLAALDANGAPLVEVEDGFLRSAGLGADCVPPLSITVDRRGAYFDPAQASELERMLETADFDAAELARAAALRDAIVASGLSKYAAGAPRLARPGGDGRRHVLVTGQVEDDRSVRLGGGAVQTNLELLRRARAAEPDGYLIYKPHPDVEAGHRTGAIADTVALQFADRIERDAPISSLIDMVDCLHVNTSLAGFEALLRHKQVVTHGAPFYAGWGLTDDRGVVPSRRTRRLSLDALVAGVLLRYPRYLDPETGLPCPAETLVARLAAGRQPRQNAIVALRQWQGKANRLLGRITGRGR